MDLSAAAASRQHGAQPASFITGGLTAWLCGTSAIALVGAMIVLLVRAGWQGFAETLGVQPGFGTLASLGTSVEVIALALPAASLLSFLAAVAAAEPAIGGSIGRALNISLRGGPAVPSIVFAVAAFAVIAWDGGLVQRAYAMQHPFLIAAIALAAFNLPIMTARFRTVIRTVPRSWRIAATAAGATPADAFLRVVLPRIWSGVAAVVLNGFGQMLGETVLLAVIWRASTPVPLSVLLWERIALRPLDAATVAAAASETLLLVALIVALRFAARILTHGRRRVGSLA